VAATSNNIKLLFLMVLILQIAIFNVLVLLDLVALFNNNEQQQQQQQQQQQWWSEDRSIKKISTTRTTTRRNIDYDYDAIYNSFGTHESYNTTNRHIVVNFNTFGNYTSPAVRTTGCRLTVSIVDPRPPTSDYNHPIWFALESVAMYVPYACVVFHTSDCHLNNIAEGGSPRTTEQRLNLVAQYMYNKSLPLFRHMMEHGQVRINILNDNRTPNKYSIPSCNDFGKGNSIFLNINFWLHEFIDNVDSDMILTLQSDSVICHDFVIELWNQYAYVGAPWAQWIWNCGAMKERWYDILSSKCNSMKEKYTPEESMSKICTPHHGGLQGNGGLSLRNRKWMIEAIRRCPSQYSGLSKFQHLGDIAEDLFFSTVLNALNSSMMPTAYEASLFAVESIFLEQLLNQSETTNASLMVHPWVDVDYNFTLDKDEIQDTVQRLWGYDTGMTSYDRTHRRHDSTNNHTTFTIPLALHQPWNGILKSACGAPKNKHNTAISTDLKWMKCSKSYFRTHPEINQECKFLKYIYNYHIDKH